MQLRLSSIGQLAGYWKPCLIPLIAALGPAIGQAAYGQSTTNTAAKAGQIETNAPTLAAKSEATLEALEAKFRNTLSNATFAGRWCSVRDGKMGPEQEDKYSIVGAGKIGGDLWLISARIQYGERDFVAPIPVKVKWAGDTPVITVDNLGIPGSANKYSARVLIYDGTYAGRWSGGGHGGLLNGVITKNGE